MTHRTPKIIIRDAYIAYGTQVLFDSLTLTIESQKITCLLGPSGIGKSTLLRLIAGLIHSDEKTHIQGKVRCDNNLPLLSNISYMAQTDLLLPWLTAWDNALLGYRLRGDTSPHAIANAKKLFEQVGLKGSETKYPHQLSGGMKQRIALIRTLVENKPIILMDEPFSSLDAITRFELQNLASELLKDRTVLLVTHDPMEALRIADEILIMYGRPIKLKNIPLHTPTPRKLSDTDVVEHQELLFDALLKAKENER